MQRRRVRGEIAEKRKTLVSEYRRYRERPAGPEAAGEEASGAVLGMA